MFLHSSLTVAEIHKQKNLREKAEVEKKEAKSMTINSSTRLSSLSAQNRAGVGTILYMLV